jgi:hypothetical protein
VSIGHFCISLLSIYWFLFVDISWIFFIRCESSASVVVTSTPDDGRPIEALRPHAKTSMFRQLDFKHWVEFTKGVLELDTGNRDNFGIHKVVGMHFKRGLTLC